MTTDESTSVLPDACISHSIAQPELRSGSCLKKHLYFLSLPSNLKLSASTSYNGGWIFAVAAPRQGAATSSPLLCSLERESETNDPYKQEQEQKNPACMQMKT